MSDKTWGHCNRCSGSRNQNVLHRVERTFSDDENGHVNAVDVYELLQCAGCESIVLRLTETAEWLDGRNVTYFPPSISRKNPSWMWKLGLGNDPERTRVHGLLREIYVAEQNKLPTLVAMGVRSLLEQIMIGKCGDQGAFNKNLAAFESVGHIGKLGVQRLEAILDVGHAAMHRGFVPGDSDIQTLLEITESIVCSVYLHDASVDRMRKGTPQRSASKKSTGDV